MRWLVLLASLLLLVGALSLSVLSARPAAASAAEMKLSHNEAGDPHWAEARRLDGIADTMQTASTAVGAAGVLGLVVALVLFLSRADDKDWMMLGLMSLWK